MNLQTSLLKWFHLNARPLPWRRHYRPYEVWVSEVMLQQTQIETVLPYFKRWMKTFPTIRSLATADEKKVLKLWEGLGYYSRARNLHQNAKLIMQQHRGVFPRDFDTILSLKGIGRYTAGAIASIAFNEEKPIVDGNIFRVLSRVYAIHKPIDAEKNKAVFWRLEEKLIPKGQARNFNQALMELGALICTKQNPGCRSCPINNVCVAYKNGETDKYPVRKNKKKMVKIEAGALVLSKNEKYLIHKRPLGKIMGGLWEFPEWKLARETRLTQTEIKEKTLKQARREFGENLEILKYLGTIKRNYTHHNERLHVFSASPPLLFADSSAWESVWVSKKELARYPFSSAHAKIVALLDGVI